MTERCQVQDCTDYATTLVTNRNAPSVTLNVCEGHAGLLTERNWWSFFD